MSRFLGSGFLDSAERFPERPAVYREGVESTYAALRERVLSLAATLAALRPEEGPRLTAVLAERGPSAFAGILGTLLSGHGYVPLNPEFPADRTASMLARSTCSTLVVDAACTDQLAPLLPRCPDVRLVMLPGGDDETAERLAAAHPGVGFVPPEAFLPAEDWLPPEVDPEAPAYLLFTSGSTGVPKGVAVSHASIAHFLEVVVERYGLCETDRFTQMFELGFDLSLFDLFAAWGVGACLCSPTHGEVLMADQFVRDAGVTVWFSVPSNALLLRRLRKLEPGAFPGLRVSLFCGEALPADVASSWARAAPDSVVENLYGPTEATLACTLYRWREPDSLEECEGGIVPIGEGFPGTTVRVADDDLAEVPEGESGELLVAGPQVAIGYWNDPETTAARFVVVDGERFYRTGDRVRRARPGGPLVYLGRTDHQVKIHGHRVELGDVEAAVRRTAGADVAVVLPWPVREGKPQGLVAFAGPGSFDPAAALAEIRELLPDYMTPSRIIALDRFPLNPNGKVDRKALAERLESGGRRPDGRGS